MGKGKSKMWGYVKTAASIGAGAIVGAYAVKGFEKLVAARREKEGELEARALPPAMPTGAPTMPMPIPFVQPQHVMPNMMPLVSFGMPMMHAMPTMPTMPAPVYANPWPNTPAPRPTSRPAKAKDDEEEEDDPVLKAFRDLDDDDDD
jgi:hypothetical protein